MNESKSVETKSVEYKELKSKDVFGVNVKLLKGEKLIIETLERIGICNKNTKVITPSCYLKKTQNGYKICHFKELLAMRGYKKEIIDNDYERRDSIATLLEAWGLVKIEYNRQRIKTPVKIFVLKRYDKDDYTINHKYEC